MWLFQDLCVMTERHLWSSDIHSLQRMIPCEWLDTYVDFSDCIFHFFHAENLPVRQASSPKEFRLRSYTVKCVRFASQRIEDLALATLDLSTLADVALCCLDDSAQSTSYWV